MRQFQNCATYALFTKKWVPEVKTRVLQWWCARRPAGCCARHQSAARRSVGRGEEDFDWLKGGETSADELELCGAATTEFINHFQAEAAISSLRNG